MSELVIRKGARYFINTPCGRYTKNNLAAVRSFCRENGFFPVYVGPV